MKHFIRRAFPKIWRLPVKDEVYSGIAWACAARDYWYYMWEMLGEPVPDPDLFFHDLFDGVAVEDIIYREKNSDAQKWFTYLFRAISPDVQEDYRSHQAHVELARVYEHIRPLVIEYNFPLKE